TRVLPNLTVIVPCDAEETRKATLEAAKIKGPVYVRFAREKSPVMTTKKTPFKVGRAEIFRQGDDLTIIAAGPLLYQALLAAEQLAKDKIQARVINLHTIKPLDVKAIVAAAKETGAIVSVEEAQMAGGLGGAVAETLGSYSPVPLERIGLPDRFAESGDSNQVLEGLGLTAPYIKLACERVLKRKAGQAVPAVPEYVTAAAKNLQKMKKEIINESLARVPKKWGGTKPDNSLKSRKMPKQK
ncbi:hypothetical protein KJ611_00575, partial [Patescibacteria group bacterium]|nr:hypothetical protein [Patescibacteria group bacterium]